MTAAALKAVALGAALDAFEAACVEPEPTAPDFVAAFAAAGFGDGTRVADHAYHEREGGRLVAGFHVTDASSGCFLRAEIAPVEDLCDRIADHTGAPVTRVGARLCYRDLGQGAHTVAHDICPDRPEALCLWLTAFRRGE